MWDIFNWSGGKKKKPKKKTGKTYKKQRAVTGRSLNQKTHVKPQTKITKEKNETANKNDKSQKEVDLTIEKLRKEFEDKQKIIASLEKKLKKKQEEKLPDELNHAFDNPKKFEESLESFDEKYRKKSNLKEEVVSEELKETKNYQNFEPVFDLIDVEMEESFLGGLIVDKANHFIIYTHNINADDSSFLATLINNIENALKKSSFPKLNKYYLMDLEKDFLMLNLLFESHIYYLIFNKQQTNLGLILNVLYDKLRQKHLEIINQ